jgi:hypothetical protein
MSFAHQAASRQGSRCAVHMYAAAGALRPPPEGDPMNLDEVPYECRKLSAVDVGSSLKDMTGTDGVVADVSALVPVVGFTIAGWQRRRRRALGIT